MAGKGLNLKSIKGKLLMGFGVVVVLCCIVGVINYNNASHTVTLSDELEQRNWPATDGTMMMKAAVQKKLYCLHGYLLEDEEAFLRELDGVYEEEKEYMTKIKESGMFPSDYSELERLNAELNTAITDIVKAHKAGDDEEIERIMDDQLDPTAENIEGLLLRMDETIDAEMHEHTKEMHESSTSAEAETMALTIAATVIGFGIAIYTSNNISRNVNEVAGVAKRIGEGDYSARSNVKTSDEIGQLSESINWMGNAISKAQENIQKGIQDLIDSVDTPIMKIDKDFTVTLINNAGAAVAGKNPKEAVGMKCYQLFKTPDCNTEECKCYQAMKYKESRTGETIARPIGNEIPIMYTGSPVFDQNGEVVGAVEYVVNLTEIKRKEKEIQEVIDGIETPVMKIDKDFNILMMNRAGAAVAGKRPEEVVGMKCYQLFKTSDCNTEECKCYQAMRHKDTRTGETIARPMGKDIPILYTGTPLLDERGEVVGAVEYVVNITEMKEKEAEIIKAKEYVESEVNRLLPVVEAAANGDLSLEITAKNDDALGKLINSFNDMRASLKGIIDQINDVATSVSSSSEQLSASIEEISSASRSVSETSQKISAGAEEQTAALENSNKQMEEISGITEETASNAENVLEIANDASGAAAEGYTASSNAIKNMDELAAANADVSREVEELEKKAGKIGEIVDIITTIAEQTALLALNANIEAARVGEQGRGFAVVAGEVGKLANETQESARNIGELIKEIQNSMNRLVNSVKDSGEKTEGAVKAVSDVMDKIERIKKSIEDTVTGMGEIKKAMDDQANAVQNLAATSDKVYQVAVENAKEIENTAAAAEEQATSVDEITRSSEELSSMAENLISMVKRFKLN